MPAELPLQTIGTAPIEPLRSLRVALISMPWALPDRPSIQCGLLKASLTREGHDVTVHYFNVALAAAIGPTLFTAFTEYASQRMIMLGEWLFTVAAFDDAGDDAVYRAEFPEIDSICSSIGMTFADLCRLRRSVLPQWLQAAVGAVAWEDYDLVGFSSTFEQQVASLAAAKVVKSRAPLTLTMMGGANVDGEMGLEHLRFFSDIDYIIIGEADESLPRFVAELSHGRQPPNVPGVFARKPDGSVHGSPPRPVHNMDALPLPDYYDYFDALEASGQDQVLGSGKVRLLAEFSRGCWWGQKHHCTFCGLNALGMDYRSKSPERAVEDILQLSGSLQQLCIDAVDNILDMKYITVLCDMLAPYGYDLTMFFEVKANLTPHQLEQLRRAGVTAVQPGIESLSTNVLRIMDKGTDMLTNVRLLRWARQYGINVAWNILTGFPGESEADYLDQVALMPALHHLQPPGGVGDLWLERFSPYFNTPPESFHDIRPSRAYSVVYPFDDLNHSKIAYFFEYEARDRIDGSARQALLDAVQQWRTRYSSGQQPPTLEYKRGPGWLRIVDRRRTEPANLLLDDWRVAAYLRCGDAPRTPAALTRDLVRELDKPPDGSAVEEFLQECVERQIAVTERGRYLSIAVGASH